MIEARWEHGSDQHWIEPNSAAVYPWSSCALYGCGRYALDALLRSLHLNRLWIPSFFCQEVVAALPRDHVRVMVYEDRPTAPLTSFDHVALQSGDAVLIVNTLGLRDSSPRVPKGVMTIEDHTHDLWSEWATGSTADYCVGSLRKLLPVPDGGIVWSPRGHALPAEPAVAEHHSAAVLSRLSAMVLKAAYLAGGAVEKLEFRELALQGEAAIASGPPSGISAVTRASLGGYPVQHWRSARASNFQTLCAALTAYGSVRVLLPAGSAVPYTVTIRFESHTVRERVRKHLIEERIYPAILWSLEDPVLAVPASDIELSRRILCVHCDHRYTAGDMTRVAAALGRAIAAST